MGNGTWKITILIFVLICSCRAQISAPRTASGVSVPGNAAGFSTSISPGDLLEISVFDTPELTQQVRVGSDGIAELALIGVMRLSGLSTQEAAARIGAELKKRQLLLSPQVNVLIKETSARGVSLVGEVEHPGMYALTGPRSLLDVLSMAGGPTKLADTKVSIQHRDGLRGDVTVSLNGNDAHALLANDIQVYPGDLVVVPRAGIVYVLGAVNRPGGFVIHQNGQITVLQALAEAGGAAPAAATNRAVILHKNAQGYVSTNLHIKKIVSGHEADVELRPDDVIFIPSDRLKNFLHGTQDVATSIGSASIYAVVH